jgi:hypothetical protein
MKYDCKYYQSKGQGCLCSQCPSYKAIRRTQQQYTGPSVASLHRDSTRCYYGRKNLRRRGIDTNHGMLLSEKELKLLEEKFKDVKKGSEKS